MVSCWFPMVSAWFPCCVIHEFHGFLVVSIWFPLVFTTNGPPRKPAPETTPETRLWGVGRGDTSAGRQQRILVRGPDVVFRNLTSRSHLQVGIASCVDVVLIMRRDEVAVGVPLFDVHCGSGSGRWKPCGSGSGRRKFPRPPLKF